MSKFTVVLQKPLPIAEAEDADTNEGIYVSMCNAEDYRAALVTAQWQAYDADTNEWGVRAMRKFEVSPGDYRLLVMFEGHHTPCMIGNSL